MKTWTSVLALLVAPVLIAASAFAQAPAPKDKADDKTGSGAQSPSAPSTSGEQTPPSSSTSDADKSDRKDTMKSDTDKRAGRGAGERVGGGGNREQVRAAQQALKEKGHDPGAVDGVMGPKTQAALKDFQKAQGIKETGRLDAETMAKLGVESKTSGTESSSPAASPKTGASGAGSPSGGSGPSDTQKSDTQKSPDSKQAK